MGSNENRDRSVIDDRSEGEVVDTFFKIVQNKIVSASRDGRHKAAWEGVDGDQYRAERNILKKHYKPLLWGIGSSFVTFAAFRISKSRVFSQRASGLPGRREELFSMPQKEREQRDLLNKGLTIPVDLALSLLIGCSVTLFLTEKQQLQRDMSTIPLVPGRSLVSDELCEDFISEYKRIPSEFWKEPHHNYPSLYAISDFVLNCQKREAYERILRRDRNVSPADPVSIPRPGVPVGTIPVDANDDDPFSSNDTPFTKK